MMVCEACKREVLTDANGAPKESYVSVPDEVQMRWLCSTKPGPMEGRELYYHARCYRPASMDKLWGETLDSLKLRFRR